MTATTETSELVVTVERQPGSRVQLTIEAPAEELERSIENALRRFGRQMRVPGFRPGKAPVAIIERQIGWESVRQEAIELLVPAMYVKALDREQIDPVGEPEVKLDADAIERGRPVTFSVVVTVKPEVTLSDYRSMRAEQPSTTIGDEEVDAAIAEARKRHATLVEVDRGAEIGDVLVCVLEMRHGDEILTAAGQERELEVDPDNLLAGLADAIVGIKAGQDRSFTLTLPDDYPREELRNQEVAVTCAAKAVKVRELPPLDDSFAVLDRRGETLAELRENYTQMLTEQAATNDRETFESAMLSQFRDSLDITVPDAMIDAEIDRSLRDLEYQMSRMGLPWDQYLAMTGQTIEQMRGERREAAVQRIKLELGLDELAKAEGIEVDESAVHREEKRIAGNQKLTASQRQRLHQMAHVDLARQAAAARLLEIGRGDV